MTNGTVKFFDNMKGFGFIEREKGEDVYVNFQDVVKGPLHDGDEVEFDVEEGTKGPRAKNVKKVE
jgi:CspA family cold shock protein